MKLELENTDEIGAYEAQDKGYSYQMAQCLSALPQI